MSDSGLTRRAVLKAGAAAGGAAAVGVAMPARAQTPRRGGASFVSALATRRISTPT
jgi:hypothetical protein